MFIWPTVAICEAGALGALGRRFESCRPDWLVVSALVAVETLMIVPTGHCLSSFKEPVEVLTALAILPFLAALVVGAREAEDASRNS